MKISILKLFICFTIWGFAFDVVAQTGAGQDSIGTKHIGEVANQKSRLKIVGDTWKNVFLTTPGDFVHMGKELTEDWKRTAAYLGGISVVILADKPLTRWYQDNVEKNIDYHLPKLPGSTGNQFFRGNDAYLNYGILATYAGSLIANYETGQRASLNSIKALAYSYLIVQVGLKAAFARQRPNPELSSSTPPRPPFTNNAHEFFHFRPLNFGTGADGTSFPSLHATAYYAVAKVMAMEFNNYWIPYSAVTFIFFADLKSHQHWLGDMIAGGLLGTLIGKGIVNSSRHRKKEEEKLAQGLHHSRKNKVTYQILPSVSSNFAGLSLNVSL